MSECPTVRVPKRLCCAAGRPASRPDGYAGRSAGGCAGCGRVGARWPTPVCVLVYLRLSDCLAAGLSVRSSVLHSGSLSAGMCDAMTEQRATNLPE
eukprot:1902614-Pleurochrysis_carterae.AAC.2